MAKITLTDTSSASIDATVPDDSVLGKAPASFIHFLRSDVIAAMDQALDKVQINSLSIGFQCGPSFSLSGGTLTVMAGGGPTGEIDLYKPARNGTRSPLFPADQFGTDIEMGSNYYLALSFQLSFTGKDSSTAGAFTLTPTASATASAKLYLPFGPDANGLYPTLKNALEALYGSFTLPSSTNDFNRLPAGAVFVYDSNGTVCFQTKLDLLATVNPTASPGISTSYGPIHIGAGPEVTVGGKFSLTGEFQVRMWKKGPNMVQIGYYKKRGSSFALSFDASAGIDVTVGGYDVISKIYGLLGDSGKLDPTWLSAHIPGSVAADVQSAYKSAVQTKLSIAMDEECDTSVTDQVALSWNFDLSKIDGPSQNALSSVIGSDLSPLMDGTPLPAGITKAGNVFDRMKEAKHTLTFNFLGLFDHATVQDSTLDISAKASEDGQLILTDTAHLTRLSATATPFVKSDQLRKVLAEDCVATIGYSASFGSFVPQLKVGYSYFNYKGKAQRTDLQLFTDIAGKLGEANAAGDWAMILRSNTLSQCASLFASLGYDGASGRALFLDKSANPRSIADFEEIGRLALLATPGLGLNTEFINYLHDPAKWRDLLNAGTAQHFYQILRVDLGNPPQWATLSSTWTSHVASWAPAMHSAGQALQAVLQYLNQNPGIYPLHDAGFLQRRQTFANQLKSAIQKTPLFHDAFGLMTIFLAAAPSNKNVAIRYAGLTKTYA